MPLENAKPGTPGFSRNIATEIKAGKPQKQAVAIAYSKAREDAGPTTYTVEAIRNGKVLKTHKVNASSEEEARRMVERDYYGAGARSEGRELVTKLRVVSQSPNQSYKDSASSLDSILDSADRLFEKAAQLDDQPRDADGKFGSGGGSSKPAPNPHSKNELAYLKRKKASKSEYEKVAAGLEETVRNYEKAGIRKDITEGLREAAKDVREAAKTARDDSAEADAQSAGYTEIWTEDGLDQEIDHNGNYKQIIAREKKDLEKMGFRVRLKHFDKDGKPMARLDSILDSAEALFEKSVQVDAGPDMSSLESDVRSAWREVPQTNIDQNKSATKMEAFRKARNKLREAHKKSGTLKEYDKFINSLPRKDGTRSDADIGHTHNEARRLFEAGKVDQAWEVAQKDKGLLPGVTKDKWVAEMKRIVARNPRNDAEPSFLTSAEANKKKAELEKKGGRYQVYGPTYGTGKYYVQRLDDDQVIEDAEVPRFTVKRVRAEGEDGWVVWDRVHKDWASDDHWFGDAKSKAETEARRLNDKYARQDGTDIVTGMANAKLDAEFSANALREQIKVLSRDIEDLERSKARESVLKPLREKLRNLKAGYAEASRLEQGRNDADKPSLEDLQKGRVSPEEFLKSRNNYAMTPTAVKELRPARKDAEYNEKSVNEAIAAQNRSGRGKVGGREGKMIHALLKGSSGYRAEKAARGDADDGKQEYTVSYTSPYGKTETKKTRATSEAMAKSNVARMLVGSMATAEKKGYKFTVESSAREDSVPSRGGSQGPQGRITGKKSRDGVSMVEIGGVWFPVDDLKGEMKQKAMAYGDGIEINPYVVEYTNKTPEKWGGGTRTHRLRTRYKTAAEAEAAGKRLSKEFDPGVFQSYKVIHDPVDWQGKSVKKSRSDAEGMSEETKERHEGRLTETEREQIGRPGDEKREDMPEDVFLEPAERKFPVKEKKNGVWVYDRELLLAAARRARMEGKDALAEKADHLRSMKFGSAEQDSSFSKGDRVTYNYSRDERGNAVIEMKSSSKPGYWYIKTEKEGTLLVPTGELEKK